MVLGVNILIDLVLAVPESLTFQKKFFACKSYGFRLDRFPMVATTGVQLCAIFGGQ